MSLSEHSRALIVAIASAPFLAIILSELHHLINVVETHTRIEGGGELAESQESVGESTHFGLDLIALASDIETVILAVLVLLGLIAYFRAKASGW